MAIIQQPSPGLKFLSGLEEGLGTYANQKLKESALKELFHDNAKARALALLHPALTEQAYKQQSEKQALEDFYARNNLGENIQKPFPQQQLAQSPQQLGSMQQLMGANNWMQKPQQTPIQNLLNPPQQVPTVQQPLPQSNVDGYEQHLQQRKRIQDLNADELSSLLAQPGAPESLRRQMAPRLAYLTSQEAAERNITKAEAAQQVATQKTLNKDAHDLYTKVLKPDAQQASVFLKNLQHAEKVMEKHPEYFGTTKGSFQNMLPQDLREDAAKEIASAFANIELDKLGSIKGIKNVATLTKIGEGKPRLGQTKEANKELIKILKEFAMSNRQALKDFNQIVPDATKVPADFQTKLDALAEQRVNKILGIEEQESEPTTKQAISPEVLAQLPNPSQYPEGKILRHPETKEGFKVVNGQWEGGY